MKRIGSLDAVKALAMFLVVWGHAILHLGPLDKLDDRTFTFINSFHMPLFMIVAVFFLCILFGYELYTIDVEEV